MARPWAWVSLLLLLLIGSAPPAAAVARVNEHGRIRLHYNRAPLKRMAEEVGRALGERIAIDPSMAGTFTITIDRAVEKDEALALLEAALVMQGYVLLRSGEGTLRVLQIQDAANASPWAGPVDIEEDRNKLVTTMVTLEKTPAAQVVGQIQHLVSKNDSLVAYEPSNSLIMTGTERRVRRMMQLARALDTGGGDDLWVRTLRHRGAIDVSEMLRQVLAPAAAAEAGSYQEPDAQIWADERINSILVLGTESQLERARAFVAEIDQARGVDTKIQVLRLHHRDAVEIQELLIALAAGRVLDERESGADVFGKNFITQADPATNSLIVDSDPETFATLLEVIERLDRPKPRIQLDVISYAISSPSQMRLGVDWFLPILEPNSDGSGTILGVTSNPSGGGLRAEPGDDTAFFGRVEREPLTVAFEDENGVITNVVVPRETLVFTADAREVQAKALMRPRLLLTSGEEQRIFAGQNVPILVGQTNDTGIQTSNQIQRQDVGVELRATARLGEEGEVALDIFIEVSAVTESAAGDTSLVGPTLESRKIETTLYLEDNEMAVIGMSQDGERLEDLQGTPGLSEIPVLGWLFNSGGNSNQDRHILFSVQARILNSPEEDFAEAVRQRLALERSLSRVEGLKRLKAEPYALLVTTVADIEEARQMARDFERDGFFAQVGTWDSHSGGTYHDVYLTGYDRLETAGRAAYELTGRGFTPQVVVLPGAVERAQSPALRLLGGEFSRVLAPEPLE